MKQLLIITCVLFGTFLTAWSQLNFDIKLGISPGANPLSAGIIVNRDNPYTEFQFNMVNVKPQFYGGVVAHLQLTTPFFLEGGISYTKRTSLYKINYRIVTENNPAEQYMNESDEMILLPLNVGVGLGSIDITSGLTAMKTISKSTELSHLKGFNADDNSFRMGWQMGIRYAFHRTMLGVEYQGTLNRVGQGMYVNGKSLEIMNVSGRMVFTMQYRF